MNTKVLTVLMICFALLLTACSSRTTYEEMQQYENDSNVTMEELDAEAQRLMEEQGLTEEDSEEPESSNPNTMKRCAGGNDPSYLIYLSDENAYQKVSMGGGITYIWLTKYQSCALTEPSEVPKECISLGVSVYNQNYLTVQQLTEEPLASVMGLKCTNVEYDENMFNPE